MNEIPLLNNRYQVLEERGKGGMAFIYHARDLMLERDVAIKVLREDYSDDPVFQEHFRQEARAAANLSHPNIVTVHDFGLDQGKLFIVMEYVPGVDLKTHILQRGRFTPDEALPLIIQACAGIGYAHRAGLVHCDVKPQNMLVMPDQRLKVTDFGIARALATIHPMSRQMWYGVHLNIFHPNRLQVWLHRQLRMCTHWELFYSKCLLVPFHLLPVLQRGYHNFIWKPFPQF